MGRTVGIAIAVVVAASCSRSIGFDRSPRWDEIAIRLARILMVILPIDVQASPVGQLFFQRAVPR
jgi:hypothetical protein